MSNIKKFEENLSVNKWDSTLSTYDLIKAYSSFSNEFFGIFDESFPFEEQSIKPKTHKSWLTKELKKKHIKKTQTTQKLPDKSFSPKF